LLWFPARARLAVWTSHDLIVWLTPFRVQA